MRMQVRTQTHREGRTEGAGEASWTIFFYSPETSGTMQMQRGTGRGRHRCDSGINRACTWLDQAQKEAPGGKEHEKTE